MEPKRLPMQSMTQDLTAVFQFAESYLGHASLEFLKKHAEDGEIEGWMKDGVNPEDACLRKLHGKISTHPEIAEEFFAYFFEHLLRLRVVDLYPGLRRFLDTGDLVQSVLGDIWPDLGKLNFESRSEFLSLLRQRMKWKAGDKKRFFHAQRRREDLRVSATTEEMGVAGIAPSALTQQINKEEHNQMLLALFRLPQRDRTLVKLHMRGASGEEMAEKMGLSLVAARKALERALKRVRSLVLSRHGR